MKIYPCKHNVKVKKQIDIGDIPLAYLYGNTEGCTVDIKIRDQFAHPYSCQNVQPYQVFQSSDIWFFDESKNKILPDKYLSSRGSQFYVKPLNIISESKVHPTEEFTYRVHIRKNGTYQKSVKYNIKVAASDMTLAYQLSKICCNNGIKKLYPQNILFNDGTVEPHTFVNQNEKSPDFFFLTLSDLSARAVEQKISVTEYIKKLVGEYHTNLWILDKSFDDSNILSPLDETFYELTNPQIFSSVNGTTPATKVNTMYSRFYTDILWDKLADDDFEYIQLFSSGGPIQVIRNPGGGYIILSHPGLIEESDTYVKLILETIMYVYLTTYYQTERYASFVTDDTIDYFININHYYGLCHPKINLTRILAQEQFNIMIPYSIEDVEIDKNAAYIGSTRFQDLRFKKTSPRLNDRIKGNNILAYTSEKRLVIYAKTDTKLQTIETGVHIVVKDNMTLQIDPIYSTSNRIVSDIMQTVSLSGNPGTFILIYRRDNDINPFAVIPATSNITDDIVPLADIEIEDNLDIVYKDIRLPGGGEWSAIPNYEMIDTGSLKGRPLRYGSLLIIQLPERFRKIKAQLMAEVRNHMASGDYPILIFKD